MKKNMYYKINILMVICFLLSAGMANAWRSSCSCRSSSRFRSFSYRSYSISYGPRMPTVRATPAVSTTQKNSGSGGPTSSYDPPNIYNKPTQTSVQQQTAQNLFSTLFSSGVTRGTSDRDATPE